MALAPTCPLGLEGLAAEGRVPDGAPSRGGGRQSLRNVDQAAARRQALEKALPTPHAGRRHLRRLGDAEDGADGGAGGGRPTGGLRASSRAGRRREGGPGRRAAEAGRRPNARGGDRPHVARAHPPGPCRTERLRGGRRFRPLSRVAAPFSAAPGFRAAALERLGRIYQFVSIRTDVYAYSRLKRRPWVRFLRHRDAAPADGPGDPGGLVECLAGALDGARVTGQEALSGAQTTHYRARLDLERAAQRLPTGARWRVLQYRNGEEALLPADVWLDGEGRLRRTRLSESVRSGTARTVRRRFRPLRVRNRGTDQASRPAMVALVDHSGEARPAPSDGAIENGCHVPCKRQPGVRIPSPAPRGAQDAPPAPVDQASLRRLPGGRRAQVTPPDTSTRRRGPQYTHTSHGLLASVTDPGSSPGRRSGRGGKCRERNGPRVKVAHDGAAWPP